MPSPIAFAAGAAAWTLTEYALHRFAGHAPRQRERSARPTLLDGDFGSEHQAHHTDTRYFTPTPRKVKAAAVALTAIGGVGSLLVGPRRALSFAAGFGVAYAAYEVLHRRTHTHAPLGPYGRWARRNHLSHHFASPATNHGVTSPAWDLVFGTHRDHGKIRVPRRHAPPWLLDEAGGVRPEYAAEYELASASNGQSARAEA
ncbi:MAG: sterol desaturase family protein [Polyangiaceae bacterium]|nr:sterol desaturase family protein [Polyangiaceae bacterium]